jgi:polyisoprenoid-binding protein YceI
MKKKAFLFGLMCFLVFCQDSWAASLVNSKSQLIVLGTQMGANVQGQFHELSGTLIFSDQDLIHSSAEISVDINSIDLASPDSEDEIKGKRWFDLSSFPRAQFKSSHIQKLSPEHYQMEGIIMIKGISQPVHFPVTIKKQGSGWFVDGTITLKRTDFRVGEGVWDDPDSVGLMVSAHLLGYFQ